MSNQPTETHSVIRHRDHWCRVDDDGKANNQFLHFGLYYNNLEGQEVHGSAMNGPGLAVMHRPAYNRSQP
jgi:hypothetical protein